MELSAPGRKAADLGFGLFKSGFKSLVVRAEGRKVPGVSIFISERLGKLVDVGMIEPPVVNDISIPSIINYCIFINNPLIFFCQSDKM